MKAVRGRIAEVRGTVAYCLESLDLPDGLHFDTATVLAEAVAERQSCIAKR